MNADESPFDILGILPSAELIVVNAAYKALARKYHPDMNPGVSAEELNRRMAKLNWARAELERDLEGWRRRAMAGAAERPPKGEARSRAGPAQSIDGVSQPTTRGPKGIVWVEPQVLTITGRKGSTAMFMAVANDLVPSSIRARYKPGIIEVQRLSATGVSANFSVSVTEDFASDIDDDAIETVEVRAPGFISNKVFVAVAPVSLHILSQQYGKRVAPPRHASYSARISFGKHRGRTFQEIAVAEPGYLEWMLREGAGSMVERECARLALNLLHGGTFLPETKEPIPAAVRAAQASRPAPALPDPSRPGGLWAALKRLFMPD